MSLFDSLKNRNPDKKTVGAIPGGKQKGDGSHDHRTNREGDRTPAQKEGDNKRRRKD